MKTITGKNSLLLWNQNKNGVEFTQGFNDNRLDDFIKSQVISFFTKLFFNECFHFHKAWNEVLLEFRKTFPKDLEAFFVFNFNYSLGSENIKKVTNKVVGNIGEIFAEYFFKHFGGTWIDTDEDYIPIDPLHENYTDARATSPDHEDIPVFIQVKNWVGEIGADVFNKAATEDAVWIRTHSKDERDRYLEQRRQIIFSFTDKKYSGKKEDFDQVVIFVGPSDINNQIQTKEARQNICKKILKKLEEK